MSRGKHAARGRFSRELTVMAIGIVVIGAIVYGILWAFTTLTGNDPDQAADTTVSESEAVTTTAVASTTTETVAATTSTTLTDAPPESRGLRDPSEISVLVLNAVGTDGLAAAVTDELTELGYQTLEPSDYDPALDQSQILFREGYGPEALELAAVVPDATIGQNRDPSDADIVVILGRSYEG